MTQLPHGATSLVSIERRDNVVYLSFPTSSPPPELVEEDSWWPWTETGVDTVSGKPSAATRPLPARWSPSPCRVLRRRFARSRLAADLRAYGWLIGFLAAVVVCLRFGEHLRDVLNHNLTGGTR